MQTLLRLMEALFEEFLLRRGSLYGLKRLSFQKEYLADFQSIGPFN